VALNYVNAAQRIVDSALTNERAGVEAARRTAAPDAAPGRQQQIQTVDGEIKQFRELNILDMTEHRSIQPIQDFVRNAPQISSKAELSTQLNDIATDMSYFEANGNLRREIDWSYLWK
jgi:hypothetical protein